MKNAVTIITKPIENGLTGHGEAIINAIATLEGKKAKITIEEYKRPRSNAQNRYYWAIVLKAYCSFFQSNGVYLSKDEMHIWIKEHVWEYYVDVVVSGIPFRKILSSTLVDVAEWEKYMFSCRAYAAENFNGMQIPEPTEQIDKHVKDWLDHPDGLYFDGDYKNYFDIQTIQSGSTTQ